MNTVLGVDSHVVAQVVEPELIVRSVGDVRGIRIAPGRRVHVRQDATNVEAEEAVHPTHPLAVTLCEVIVDRHNVNTFAGQSIEVGRQRGHEGLTFTSAHLGDVA